MTAFEERQQVIAWVQEATAAGARQAPACAALGLSARTLQRWQQDGETLGRDQRPLRTHAPPHKITAAERAALLTVANSSEFGHLPPSQSVPRLADQGRYLASESTFYRVLKAANQLAHRRRERPPQARRKPRAICATAPNQVYSWDITYLPTAIGDGSSPSTGSSTSSAARSSVGRSMTPNAAPSPGPCSPISASGKRSNPTS